MSFSFFDFFSHPVLRAPTWGCMWMCVASSLMGVLLLLRKRSLLSESLSHATYPGVVIGVSLFALFFPGGEHWVGFAVLGGAFLSSLLALRMIHWMERKGKVRSDAALCFVLAFFFGVGILAASSMQAHLPVWYKHVQMLLFGQAATMQDLHIALYGCLALVVILFISLTFRSLQASLFDQDYAFTAGIPVALLGQGVFWLLLLSLIVGIRSVGVILMSGMVIAPAVAARQFSDRLQTILWLAACFGALSGFLGNYFSVLGSLALSSEGKMMSFPTGPMIVLVGTTFALLSLLFAPHRGLAFRWARIAIFRFRCLKENILKGIWRKGSTSFEELKQFHALSPLLLRYVMKHLQKEGWLTLQQGRYDLTVDGRQKASHIVRLHRLWEVYLTEELGFQAERVHHTAEEMEHILTREMEEKLTRLLSDPKQDPHQQPIPERHQSL